MIFTVKEENMSDKIHYVYALIDPRTGEAGYIGLTNNPAKRLVQHGRKNDSPRRDKWIADVLASGATPILLVLETLGSKDEAKKAEIVWINKYLAWGVPLTNSVYPGCKKPPCRRLSLQS